MPNTDRIPDDIAQEQDTRVLNVMLCESSSWPWTVDELARETQNSLRTEDAVRRLIEAGLVYRLGEFVFPTRTARRANELHLGAV
jgi:predicted transcriptional regulator